MTANKNRLTNNTCGILDRSSVNTAALVKSSR